VSRGRRARPGDDGAAVVEFVLVGVLVTMLFAALLQLGLALYVRNTLLASAAEGARYAGNADRSPEDGAAVTRAIVRGTLSGRYAAQVSARQETVDGAVVDVVEIRAPLPVIGLVGPSRTLVVRGHALEEAAP
jgi:Flp pilus assembly protein TadG